MGQYSQESFNFLITPPSPPSSSIVFKPSPLYVQYSLPLTPALEHALYFLSKPPHEAPEAHILFLLIVSGH